MKNRLAISMLVLVLVLAAIGPSSAQAAYAYNVNFTTFITYQNIGTAETQSLYIYLYENKDDITPLAVQQPNLAKDASTSVGIGDLTTGSFNGTAVLSADQPIAAALVQLPPSVAAEPNARNRPMSTGFDAGTQNVYLATVLKKAFAPQQTTKFSIQNAGASAVSVDIEFYGSSTTPVHTINQTIQPGAGYPVDVGTIGAIADGFSGSVVAKTTGGSIVGSAMELDAVNYGSKAYEGIGQGADTFYMPSALCNFNAGGGTIQTSYYAIQNTDPSLDANITVDYGNGNSVTFNDVHPFNKASVSSCDGGNVSGFIGAATITSNRDVLALGKVNGGGFTTAFIGFPSGTGAEKIALPYVRWPTDQRFFAGTMQRTNLAIQNVGSSAITGNITVKYVNPDGTVVGTHTIDTSTLTGGQLDPGGKVNSNPTNAGLSVFGCQNNCTVYGGGAVVEGPAGSELAVLARVVAYVPSTGLKAGEDYNGIPYPPAP